MKFMIKKPLILNALSTVGRVFQTSKVALPILNNFKISVSKDNLIIVAANGETTIQTKIDTTDENGDQIINVDTEGEFLLNNRSTEMIRKLAGSDVEFDLIDNSFILISDGNSEFRLNSERVKEYPDLDLSINKDFVNLDIQQFIKAVNQVSFAASNKEMANILSAVNIKIKDKKLIMSATDANRLSRKIIDIDSDKEIEINIPSKTLIDISRMCENKKSLLISFDSRRATFKIDDTIVFSNLLTGSYPNLDTILAPKYTIDCLVNSKELIDAMGRVSLLFIDRQTAARLVISPNEFKIIARSPQFGSIEDKIKDYKFDSQEFEISLDCDYIVSALRAFDCQYVKLQFTGEVKPMFIRSDDEPNLVQVVTPLRILN